MAAPPLPGAVSTLALVAAGPDRPDLPARRAEARASLAAAVEAVRPANVKRAIAELRGDMLAKTTRGPYESRLKTWNRLAYEGEVSPWPISAHVLEVVGAGFKKGAYRSAKEYFLAAFRHQENDLRIAVDPLLRRLANRIIRSVVRGLPGSRLKEAFPVLALVPLVAFADAEPFDISRPAHSVDVYIIAVWFMLREIEVAAARVGDLVIMRAEVVLDLPIHKTAQGGERTLTRRSLHCACGATTHPLCPLHAARRHMRRMDAAGLLASSAPLFPGTGGGTRSKEDSVHFRTPSCGPPAWPRPSWTRPGRRRTFSAATPAEWRGPPSWPPRASLWPSSSCWAGGRQGHRAVYAGGAIGARAGVRGARAGVPPGARSLGLERGICPTDAGRTVGRKPARTGRDAAGHL